ncbi:EpsG family protein [Alishewanella sp. HL-SH06]|uniref:EpsG family protein n=1 Tax=Alishewanella sp. HL-SH06 TaxID=3461144 RepID=UPI004042EE4F
MLEYSFVLLLSLGLWFTSYRYPELKSIFIFILVLCFFILAALRGEVGADTFAYDEIYQRYLQSSYGVFELRFEPAFVLIMKISSYISDSSQFVIFFYALFQAVLLFFIAKKIKFPFLFLFIYFLTFYLQFHLNTIRVGLAVLLFIYSLQLNSARSSLFFLLLAVINHFSILLLIPIWMVYKDMLNWKLIIALILIFSLFLWAIFDYFLIKVALYFQTEDSKISLSGIALLLFISPFLVYITLSMLRMKFSVKMLVYNSFLVSSVVGILYVDIFYRLHTLLGLFMLFLIANDKLGFKKLYSKVAFSSVFVLSITVPAIYSVLTEQSNVAKANGISSVEFRYTFIPYDFFFNE